MTKCAEFRKSEFKGRGGFPSKGPKMGSRKWVVLSDGSTIKWWRGVWKFEKVRLDRKPVSSLQFCSQMAQPVREVTDSERYEDFGKFLERLLRFMDEAEIMKAIEWLKT